MLHSIPSTESIDLYYMLKGTKEPEKGNEVLKCYFSYHGDYNNYSKVRDNCMSDIELSCVRHGIYHHLEFAYWCKDNLPLDNSIDVHISAKLIMNNDLSHVNDRVYCIWYPELPSEETCREIVRKHPQLLYQVARVCTIANYTMLFKQLTVLPDYSLIESAKRHKSDIIYYNLYDMCRKKGTWFVMNDGFGMVEKPRPVKLTNAIDVYHPEDIRIMYSASAEDVEVSDVEINKEDIGLGFQDGDPLNTSLPSMDFVNKKLLLIEDYLKSNSIDCV